MSNQFFISALFYGCCYSKGKWHGRYGVLTDSKFMQRDEDAIFSFRWNLCYEKEKTFIIPRCTISQNLKTHQYQDSQEMRKRYWTPMHDSCPPPTMRGKYFWNLRPKNAKNHAISLLQMQGCPQSNIKQEIKSFCFKNFTKSNNELS